MTATKKSSELPVLVDSKATPMPRQFTWSWLIVVATTFLVYTLGVYTLGVWTGASAKQLFSGGAPLCAPCAPCSSPKLNDDKNGDDNDEVEFVTALPVWEAADASVGEATFPAEASPEMYVFGRSPPFVASVCVVTRLSDGGLPAPRLQ